MSVLRRTLPAILTLIACAPAAPAKPRPRDPAAEVTRLADEYVAAFFERVPEAATRRGRPKANHGGVTDNSLAATAAWQRREDSWLSSLRAIDAGALQNRPEWVTYGMLREVLEGSVAVRVCHTELWSLNTNNGWQASYPSLASLQPVGTDSFRAQALARLRALPRILATERDNLQEGIRQGYTAPRAVAEGVLRQVDGILASTVDSSPFAAPALRDSTSTFRRTYLAEIRDRLLPALRDYRVFLADYYLPRAREQLGVSANPNGAACYQASMRRFTTLLLTPAEVYRVGEVRLAEVEREMEPLASRVFGTRDLVAVRRRLREDTAFTFRTREEIVSRSRDVIARARAALPRWFGRLPQADVSIVEYPEFRQRTGAPPSYLPAAQDGSRGGIFYITTFAPDRIPRATLEYVAFHEAIPGHHLQNGLAQERHDVHEVTRVFGFSGFGEGWGLYAERLADEMGLYSGDLDRLGMLDAEAWRAARLVLDAGIHSRGWTRQQAVEFLTAHAAISPSLVQGEVDRYISWPGQATAYLIGSLTIRALRREAEQRLGSSFDIREFHDRVLGNGSVTLPMLQVQIRRWVEGHQ
jgi:uncharacterized protein (DUF885 family)